MLYIGLALYAIVLIAAYCLCNIAGRRLKENEYPDLEDES